MPTVREAAFRVFEHFGIDRLFGNPGSTELPMLKALPHGFRYVLGLGMGPYFVGIVSDKLQGDLGRAIISVNVVVPVIVLILLYLLTRINRDESLIRERARAGGEPV